MKPNLPQNIQPDSDYNSNALIMLVELKMMNTLLVNQISVDSLNAMLLSQNPGIQVRAIHGRIKEDFVPEKSVNATASFNAHKQSVHKKIAFPQKDGYEFISPENILYCNAEGAYTLIHLAGNRKFLVSKALGCVEEKLPADLFIRIHHSCIINLNAMTNYSRADGGYITMNTGEKLMVSKARRDILLQRLGLGKEYSSNNQTLQ